MDPLTHKVRPPKTRKRRKPLSEEVSNMFRVLTVTLIILGISSTGTYLYMNSLKPAKGYTLKQLQLNYEELQADQRALEHQVMEAQSFMMTIEENSLLEDMKAANNDEFTFIDDNNYAQFTE